ncbi:hypothetical protein THRCLA_01630 [Thraustotheca clavata]|uniref:Transmembrane protein n=1 Tax=Thraustotheca clavata TaxID=74557 RepID=A0A1W0A7R2_9STRA|nr:hypothetical protein THRCLA_01630 [Thraustotheca clavata]
MIIFDQILQQQIIQIYNDQLLFAPTIPNFNIIDSQIAVLLSALNNQIQPVYARKILYEELISIVGAIKGLRHYNVMLMTYLMTGYCWADFARNWAMAHTIERQTRCSNMFAANGAVYLEAILRNIDFSTWLTANEMQFDSYIAFPIMNMPDGKAWVDSLKAHQIITLGQHHSSSNIRIATKQSICIENALGQKPFLQLKSINSIERGTFWTSSYLFGALQTDFASLQPNQSLIRNSSIVFGNQNPFQLLGQLTSIDLMWIPIPRKLLAAVQVFRNELISTIESSPTLNLHNLIPEVNFNPTPQLWNRPNLTFYGGNPFYSFGSPLPIVQEAFGFDDACGIQSSLTVQWSPLSSLFAFTVASQNNSEICSQVPTSQIELCFTAVAATNSMKNVLPIINFAQTDLTQLSLMQFVAEKGTYPILNPPFTIFGLIMLYEWAMNLREAVSFHRDIQTIDLISKAYPTVESSAIPISTSFREYLWQCAAITTVGLCFVAILMATLWLIYRPKHSECMVCIGRPILFIGIWLLNTSPLELVQSHGLITHFKSPPLAWYQTILAASELTWCVFIVHDLFSFLTQQYTKLYASDSTHLTWLVAIIWIFVSPQQHHVRLERNCQYIDMDFEIVCTSGYVQIGSYLLDLELVWHQHFFTMWSSDWDTQMFQK